MIRCVLFDYDGTIADTAEIVEKSYGETVKKFTGHNVTRDEFIDVFGKPLSEMMSFYNKDKVEEMTHYYREYFSRYQDTLIRPFPGVVETIKKLKQLEVKTAIVSSRTKSGVEYGVDRFGLNDYIDLVIGLDDTKNNKPHPEPIIKAMGLLDVKAEHTLMVGDSPHDIIAAKEAGVKACVVNWSLFDKEKLQSLNPDYIISEINELIKIIKNKDR
ncbi:MAG: pyrophosphatase PpaX [Clostridiales bacterium]|nr:pyrophosphatase PpaX [Clostridiales bacterium]